MVRYPYHLWAEVNSGAVKNAEGDWQAGSKSWQLLGDCRDESNSKGATVTLEDGRAQVYDSIIYLPKEAQAVAVGAKVEVHDGTGAARLSGTVKRFSADQLHCRIWI